MSVSESIQLIVVVATALAGPVGFLLYSRPLRIRKLIEPVLVKQELGVEWLQFGTFLRMERRGTQETYFGRNLEILRLFYPRRYFYVFLQFIVFVCIFGTCCSLAFFAIEIDQPSLTAREIFLGESAEVPLALKVGAAFFTPYLATLLLAVVQKSRLAKHIDDLNWPSARQGSRPNGSTSICTPPVGRNLAGPTDDSSGR